MRWATGRRWKLWSPGGLKWYRFRETLHTDDETKGGPKVVKRVRELKAVAWQVMAVVTAFTLATKALAYAGHSIT